MATAGRKRREDIWVNFTFDVKTNKTLCKPCGAEIAGKNTTNLKRHLQGNHPEIHAKVSTTFFANFVSLPQSVCFCITETL